MPIVDAHVHLYPPEVAAEPEAWAARVGERHWAVLCTRRRRDGRLVQSLPTVDELLAAMDAARVDRAVLLGWYWEKPETCAWQNRFFAACVREHPDRLAACATIHPASGGAGVREEMRRARQDGLCGLGELSPHSQGVAMDEPVLAEAFALAGEYGWPVNLHVTDPASRPFPGRIETPLTDFSRVVRTHPGTTFILAHWGGLVPQVDPEIATLPNVYFDTAASPLMYDPGIWARFAALVPRTKVLFGSDYPLNLYPRVSVAAEMARFVAEATAAGAGAEALGGNAERVFGWCQHREQGGTLRVVDHNLQPGAQA
ncbi:amidohydrolase family protein [Opitutus sp. ER46]|uniref:amidohydrolase family protein n=1 Tax=Opitutus sp. ER46 TaxID=2161864 RepID=UPI000D312EDF|nr:amidohydrolase family protein [Opitutus sp. ER46]PTX99015.1 amidohydrolase [Opitutus sp. ER46]